MNEPLKIYVADWVRQRLLADALQLGVSSEAVCTKIVTDHYGDAAQSDGEKTTEKSAQKSPLQSAADFNVGQQFPGYPAETIRLTQLFIDEMARYPEVRVAKHKRSIVFTPRFAHIDYPISVRGAKPGLVVSFYGNVRDFDDPDHILAPGRKSYARARIVNEEQLNSCRRFIAQAYHRRFGNAQGVTQ